MSRKVGDVTYEIDMAQIEDLAGIGCTNQEMANYFGVHLSTFEKRIIGHEENLAILRGRSKFAISLRRRQSQAAEDGNVTMLVWLGKNVLGQRDNIDTRLTGGGPNGEIEHNVSASELLERGIARINARNAEGRDTGSDPGIQEG